MTDHDKTAQDISQAAAYLGSAARSLYRIASMSELGIPHENQAWRSAPSRPFAPAYAKAAERLQEIQVELDSLAAQIEAVAKT